MDRDLYEKEGEIRQLKGELLDHRLTGLKKRIDSQGILTAVITTDDKKFLQTAALTLLEEENCRLLALVNDREGDLQWIIGSQDALDFGAVNSEILPLIKGKGGGRGPLWQGKGEGPGVEDFFKAFRKKFEL